MWTLNRALRIGVEQREDVERCLNRFLSAYRQTPHSTTGCAPAALLFKVSPWDCIPTSPQWEAPELDVEATQRRRQRTNQKASERRRTHCCDFQEGDQVVVKSRRPGGKFQTPFEPETWTVRSVRGSMITVARGRKRVTRNVSHFKRACAPMVSGGYEDEDGDVGTPEDGDSVPEDAPVVPSAERVTRQEYTDGDTAPSRGERYHLRPNLAPSSQLKYFVF
ncbi:hypothetical protein NDU88_010749 [Pleurodeles waltl]|uniref:Integrase catalytic domain-containing protein n=1 Tax=Pleurodeles waltl TaxID=8319 RepID=A0AAV7S456_PLEWA|nr:hypothetical protein NDU88_010749 [Pleurodeles waltl]